MAVEDEIKSGSGTFVVGSLDGAQLTASFPLRTIVAGIDVAVIPWRDYLALKARAVTEPVRAARALLTRSGEPRRTRLPLTLERDAEVADFLRERFKVRSTLAELHSACVDRFGAERTPSTSRISGFRIRVREGG